MFYPILDVYGRFRSTGASDLSIIYGLKVGYSPTLHLPPRLHYRHGLVCVPAVDGFFPIFISGIQKLTVALT